MSRAFGRLVLVALVVFGLWYVLAHYHGGGSSGCDASGPAVAHADTGQCPATAQDLATDYTWAQQRIQSLTGQPVTTGKLYYGNAATGYQVETFQSGFDTWSDKAEAILKQAGVTMPRVGRFPAVADVETKASVYLRQNEIDYGVIVINNGKWPTGVCQGPFSCDTAIRAILVPGSTLAVWWPGARTSNRIGGDG
ncbi:MAG TPA: DddA-like double-stranded DNA deaminase toxin [Pseudonocardiaceae bacterium]